MHVRQLILTGELPYMANFLSGKTFAVGMQMTIHRKTFAIAQLLLVASCVNPIE